MTMTKNSIRRFTKAATTRHFIMLLAMLSALILFAVGCNAGQTGLTPPPDYQTVATVDLSAQPHDGAEVGQFTLTETAVVNIFYTLPNIDTTYFDLSLSGPNGDNLVILRSETFRTDENGGGSWEQRLSPGEYRLLLTAPQTSGTLSVYGNYQ